jgi:hypothetical protein
MNAAQTYPAFGIMGRRRARAWTIYFFVVVVIEFIPFALNIYDQLQFPLLKNFLAIQIILICLLPTFRYFADGELYTPIFPLICLSYAYQFAIPIFTRYPELDVLDGTVFLLDEDVNAALWLTFLGAAALIIGYYSLGARRLKARIPVVRLPLDKRKALIYCVGAVGVYSLVSMVEKTVRAEFPEAQIFVILLQNQLLVAIGIMSWIVYATEKPRLWYRLLLWFLVALQMFIGVSSTVLEQPLVGFCIVLIVKWTYTRRVPTAILFVVVLIVFFLQPVKVEVREETWYGDSAASSFEKAGLWLERATEYWSTALNSNNSIAVSNSKTLYRSDFIHQFAYIHSLTPGVIPYQYGGTYSFFLVSFVPRIIWPEKPVTAANTFFGVTYWITDEEGAKRSNFGVSLVGESYINFGLLGVLFIMGIQGAILSLIEKVFAGPKSGAGGQAVFLSCSIWLLNGVGSSAEILFGGILQNIVASCAILWWVRAPSATASLLWRRPTRTLTTNLPQGAAESQSI